MGKRRKRYSEQEISAAVERARAVGMRPASRELGIPNGTLSRWVNQRGGLEERAQEAPAASPPPAESRAKTSRRKVARIYSPSQRAQVIEDAERDGVQAASEKHGVSRWSIYQWRRQVERAAQGEGDSPVSGPDPSEVEAQRDREILEIWRKHPGLGPSQVRNQLHRQGVKVSVNTVRRVMEDAGYRPPKVRRTPHDKTFEATRPNQMWHLDFVHRYVNKASTFTLILLDDHSRFAVGHGVDESERADMVIETFEAAVERHGKPESVLHDKGSAFWAWNGISRFTALLTELGVDQVVAQNKETNGKLEVFNANLHKELYDRYRFYDVSEMRRRLGSHLHFYNHRRTHHALGGLLVPADRYYGRSDEVLARIEAGGAGEDDPLRGRMLELFKVVSVDGQPEVWLLGQRLLPT